MVGKNQSRQVFEPLRIVVDVVWTFVGELSAGHEHAVDLGEQSFLAVVLHLYIAKPYALTTSIRYRNAHIEIMHNSAMVVRISIETNMPRLACLPASEIEIESS